MKGNISLKDFIDDVKKELIDASKTESPFFLMEEVELEVSFGLNAKGKAGGKFVVFELGAEADASQMHKVKLKLTPYKNQEEDSAVKKSNMKITNPNKQQTIIQRRNDTKEISNEKLRKKPVMCLKEKRNATK